MSSYREDPDYQAASARRTKVGTEIVAITHQLDLIQLIYLRDGIKTPAVERAALVERRSAARLELTLLTNDMLAFKTGMRAKNQKDLAETLLVVLRENKLDHYAEIALSRHLATSVAA